jgi:hypothetical protein
MSIEHLTELRLAVTLPLLEAWAGQWATTALPRFAVCVAGAPAAHATEPVVLGTGDHPATDVAYAAAYGLSALERITRRQHVGPLPVDHPHQAGDLDEIPEELGQGLADRIRQ